MVKNGSIMSRNIEVAKLENRHIVPVNKALKGTKLEKASATNGSTLQNF